MKCNRENSVLRKQLLTFLNNIDNDFNPPLSRKVNLRDYVEKIITNAELILDFDGDEIIGLVVVYCNDELNERAYIPLVGVDSLHRKKGIAKKLMVQAIQLARQKGFKVLGIHSNNQIAIDFYKVLGFSVICSDDRQYLELVI